MLYLLIYLGILGGLLWAAWRWPPSAVSGLLCVQVLDFWGQMSSPALAENGTLTNLLVVAVLGLAVVRTFFIEQTVSLSFGPAARWLALLWLYALCSVAWTPAPERALEQWTQYWPYMLIALFIVPTIVRNYEHAAWFGRAMVLLGGLLALLVDLFVKWDGRYVVAFWSSDAKFWNALAFAQMAGYTAIAAALLHFRKGVSWSLVRAAIVLVCMVLAVKSGSRGQFILMVVLPVVLLPFSREYSNWRAYLSVVAMVGCVSLASYWAFDYFAGDSERWSGERFSADIDGRVDMARTVMHVWADEGGDQPWKLLFGLGNSASFSDKVVGFYPHMVPIEVLAEEGLFGIGIFLMLNVTLARRFIAALRATAGHPEHRSAVVTLAGMYLFALTLSLKQGSLLNMSPEIFLFLIMIERISYSAVGNYNPAPRRTRSLVGVPRYPNLIG